MKQKWKVVCLIIFIHLIILSLTHDESKHLNNDAAKNNHCVMNAVANIHLTLMNQAQLYLWVCLEEWISRSAGTECSTYSMCWDFAKDFLLLQLFAFLPYFSLVLH